MSYRDAKKEAWRAAYMILVSGGLPISSLSPEGIAESESSVDNHARWLKAWDEVLESIGRRGGITITRDDSAGAR